MWIGACAGIYQPCIRQEGVREQPWARVAQPVNYARFGGGALKRRLTQREGDRPFSF